MEKFIVIALNGITLTMILSTIALGLAVIFGIRGVINMAHGEFFMLGAYIVVAFDRFLPKFWGGFFLAPLIMAGIGLLFERLIIRHLYNRPIDTLLATWGLSIILRETVRITIGASYKYTTMPFSGNFSIFGAEYPAYRLFIICMTIIVFITIVIFFFRTNYGIQIRAAIANREIAESLGINTSRIDQVVFAIGSGIAGFAGALMSPILPLSPNMGIDYFAKSFMVIIIGGVGNIFGSLGGAAIIGGSESVLSNFIRPIIAQVFILFLAMIIIRFRPKGLFGGR